MKSKCILLLLAVCILRAASSAAEYKTFQERFQWMDFKTISFAPEMETSVAPLSGEVLSFLPSEWQDSAKSYKVSPYVPLRAFHFNNQLDAYLILGPSELNGRNVNLPCVTHWATKKSLGKRRTKIPVRTGSRVTNVGIPIPV